MAESPHDDLYPNEPEADAAPGLAAAPRGDAAPDEPQGPPAARGPRPWLHRPALYVVLCIVFAGLELASRHWHWPQPAVPERASREEPRRSLGERFRELVERSRQREQAVSVGGALVFLVPFLLGSSLLLGCLILRACNVRVFPRCDFRVATWSAWHLARFAVMFLVLWSLSVTGLGWLQAHLGITAEGPMGARSTLMALGANSLLMLALSLFVVALVGAGGEGPGQALGLVEPRPLSRALIGLTGMVMLFPLIILAFVFMFIYGPLVGIYPERQPLIEMASRAEAPVFAALAIVGVIIAPLTEELLFRGFLYATLRRYFAPLGAIVTSAGLFALFHGFAFGFLQLFLIGFLLAYLYERTGSLVASFAAHGAINLYSLLLVWLVWRQAGG